MRKITLFVASLLFSIGAWAQTGFSVTDTKYTSAELNALTKPTLIAIKNLSKTNHYYFVGNTGKVPYSTAEFSDSAVFVVEPTEGGFYLKKLDDTYMQTTSPKDFGTVDNAAVFSTTNPTSKGSGTAYFNGDGDSKSYINGNDDENLVRFVKGSDWINVQNGDAGTPTYNAGLGGWTIHYVYQVKGEESTSWDFTFERTSETAASVSLGGVAVEGVTASIAMSTNYKINGKLAERTDLLCSTTNSSAATETEPIKYTLTITNNTYKTYLFDYIEVSNVALNSDGNYQGPDVERVRNFKVTYGSTTIGPEERHICEKGNFGGQEYPQGFGAKVIVPAKGTYTIVLDIYNINHDTDDDQIGSGCFYGLSKITLGNTTVSFGTTGYATLYAPIALTIPEGVRAYTGTLNENKTWLTLDAIEGDIIPKENAVILEGEKGTKFTLEAATSAGTTVSNNDLKGQTSTVVTSTVNAGNNEAYTLQPNGEDGVVFKRFDGANLTGGKAYLMLPKSSAQSIGVRFEDGTTDIEHSTLTPQPSTQIYDLMGRRVEAITKGGIYIVNGKKVIK